VVKEKHLLKRFYLYPYFLLRILTNAVPSWKNSVQVKFYLVSRSCRTPMILRLALMTTC